MTKLMKLCLLTPLLLVAMSFHLNPKQSLNGTSISTQNFNFEKNVNVNPNFRDSSGVHHRNPTGKEIFAYMCEIGEKYNIPPEILYAVAYAESGFRQFNKNGTPFVSFDNGIGIMQVTPGRAPVKFDVNRAKNDYKYNIKIGAKILLAKWKEQYNIGELYGKTGYLLPSLSNKDPMILENWYFVLWAYNGYAGENNPNKLPMFISKLDGVKMKAYQDRVIDLAERDLRIKITKFPKDLLPTDQSLPSVNSSYPTPEPMHYSVLSREHLEVDLKSNYSKVFVKKNDFFEFKM